MGGDAQALALDAAWGGVDVRVNNAGIDGPRTLSWDSDLTAWGKVIDIIFSVHERIAWSGYNACTASKAGLSMLSQTLAQEAGPFGVRVPCIAPGAVRTPINTGVWEGPWGMSDLLTKIPLGCTGEVGDIAGLAVLMASDAAGYVTATTLFADGGMTNYPGFMHGG
ncbi:SDR family oxidoreductase [Deinococcus arenicola]|uniref:SDR family oxidoreductase n=1 Tax=Deinococcus arenicola TaxID=2994950 RepID=A0ABU4DX79_9DEIO|nr:SDR family oxidoreductase [Deinococcus sp. ZS9-10]MDV6376567.1 SDR family oxidoreductase [Deinococcus sp. ZS9-10]